MLCGIADQNCIAVHCGCGASILKDLDSIERRALPSPTCSPGQGGFPKGGCGQTSATKRVVEPSPPRCPNRRRFFHACITPGLSSRAPPFFGRCAPARRSIERHFRRFGGTIVLRRGCKQWVGPAAGGPHATFSACTLANKHHRLRDE